jgi:exonuclease VII small subunit
VNHEQTYRSAATSRVERLSNEHAFHPGIVLLARALMQATHPMVEEARVELEEAQSQLNAALRAWDTSVSELWRTSLTLTQAQKRVTHAHELLWNALNTVDE